MLIVYIFYSLLAYLVYHCFYNIIKLEEIMEDNIIIEERIRKIRENLKMNRENFSEMIDISDVFLGQLERGERSLSTKTLKKIVKFTGVSADFILFGNEESNSTLAKIDRILGKCSDDLLDYIYDLIHTTFKFSKKQNNL